MKKNLFQKNKRIICAFSLALSIVIAAAALSSCSIFGSGNAEKIPVLAYHKLIPAGSERGSGLEIDEAKFDKQMKYLHDKGYKTLTMDEFYKWHAGEIELPKKSVLITFDDGYYSMYYLVYPILKKYDQAATVFCIGRHIGETTDEFDYTDNVQDHYIGMDKIEEIRRDYPKFEFDSHTYIMHDRVNDEKPAEVFTKDQIMEDCKKMESMGFKDYLAYPWGTYTETMQEALKDSGIKMAFAYDPYYYALRSDDAYAVNRIKIGGGIGMREFKKIVKGKDKDCNNPDA